MLQAWSTNQIAPQDRYPFVVDTIRETICACSVSADIPTDTYEAQLEHVALGEVSMLRFTSTGTQTVNRTPQHVRVDDSDCTLLYLPLSASMAVNQNGEALTIAAGKASLFQLNRPLTGYFIADDTRFNSAVNVRIPTGLLREREPRIDRVFGRALSLNPGSGRLALSLIQSALDEGPYIGEAAAAPLGRAIVDAICSLAADELSDHALLSRTDRQRALTRSRIMECIAAHLGDPALNVETIAGRCSMSTRCVHRAFEDTDWTVAGYIREQRLKRCREELRHPELGYRSIAEIAYGWGFKDVAHFSRAYKRRFGHPPSAERAGLN